MNTRRVRLSVRDDHDNEVLGTRELLELEFGTGDQGEYEAWLMERIMEYAHEHAEVIARIAGERAEEAFAFWDPLQYVAADKDAEGTDSS